MAELILDYYSGSDQYSDGDIESKLLMYAKEGKRFEELPDEDVDFATAYHFSARRENITRWYPFKKKAALLEIGAGCGAITGSLCDKVERVYSVDLSRKRTTINYYRHKDKENLTLYAGNFDEIPFLQLFDYIVINGVFEYAGSFTEGDNPYLTFLEKVRKLLKNDGVILIAIENRLGAKYFSGSMEDHTDLFFAGINGYEGITNVHTFSQGELINLCANAGLYCAQFYYPYPDYKFPTEIFTEETINSDLYGRVYPHFEKKKFEFIHEEKLLRTFAKEDVADTFANSFLIEIVKDKTNIPHPDHTIEYVKLNSNRDKRFRIYTEIWKDSEQKRHVTKHAFDSYGFTHIQKMVEKGQNSPAGILMPVESANADSISFDYIRENNLDKICKAYIERREKNSIIELLRKVFVVFLETQKSVFVNPEQNEMFRNTFGYTECDQQYECVSDSCFDLILDNIYHTGDQFVLSDYEWWFDFPVPIKYIFWRIVNELYYKYNDLYSIVDYETILREEFEIFEADVCRFRQWELFFVDRYVGSDGTNRVVSYSLKISLEEEANKRYLPHIFECKFYIDEGHGYNENNIIIAKGICEENRFCIDYDLHSDLEEYCVRWDPLSAPCRVKDLQITIDERKTAATPGGGIAIHNSYYFFTDDPYFYLEDSLKGNVCIHLEGELELLSESIIEEFVRDYQDYITENNERYNKVIGEKDQYIGELGSIVESKDNYIKEIGDVVESKNNYINELGILVQSKDSYIVELGNTIETKDELIRDLNEVVASKDQYISELDQVVHDKDNYISELGQVVHDKDHYISELGDAINQLNITVEKTGLELSNANELLAAKEDETNYLNTKAAELAEQAELTNKYVEECEEELDRKQQYITSCESEIERMKQENNQLKDEMMEIKSSKLWNIYRIKHFVKRVIQRVTRKTVEGVVDDPGYQISYNIDDIYYEGNKLRIRGWIFEQSHEIDKLEVVFSFGSECLIKDISKIKQLREDVQAAFNNPMGLRSGFDQVIYTKLPKGVKANVKLRYTIENHTKDIDLQDVTVLESESLLAIDYDEVNYADYLLNAYEYKPLDEVIDIIVPVYNGYKYLRRLFEGLALVDKKHCIYLIDDKSPDERVLPELKKFSEDHANVTLLLNDKNLGFVKTVNRGLGLSNHNVVIVNTDVELPLHWLERLMRPIIEYNNVASVTPFSNSATIFSFPEFANNPIYRGMTVDNLDALFQRVNPRYTEVPTGMGFCMGMSRRALDTIGFLDAETFSKGYGEENDWCQRAIEEGFINVHVENVFIYHKHGGSFQAEEKQKLLDENTAKLSEKHPNYLADVARYCERDPLANLRKYLRIKFILEHGENILVFNHSIGGGATSYLQDRVREWVNSGTNVFEVQYDIPSGIYRMVVYSDEEVFDLMLGDLEQITSVLGSHAVSYIYINELVTYPDLFCTLQFIGRFAKEQEAKLVMLLHDYFAISPTINLVSTRDYVYECYGDGFHCDQYYESEPWPTQYDCPSIHDWRVRWGDFLKKCDEVRTFSEDSKTILTGIYPYLQNVTLVPHKVEYMIPVNKDRKTTTTINIGLLGVLSLHKGKVVVQDLIQYIEKSKLNMKLVLIGSDDLDPIPESKYFEKTGSYHVEDLPFLVLEHDIDIFLIPSIWPETFSYTTEEVIKMGLPIASFNIGAPAERISCYEKGLVLSSKDPERIIGEITDFLKGLNICIPREEDIRRVLFIAEYISYSSRYRVDHTREQLFAAGIDSEFIEAKYLDNSINLNRYQAVYIYRCRLLSPLKEFMSRVKGKLPIIYDIDDYIFAYDKIKELKFLNGDDYVDFDIYSQDINLCMEQSDAFITSTNTLGEAIKSQFPGRPLYINRNHASAAMFILSQKAILSDHGHKGIILGYFSGSKTHDDDFAMIEDALVEVMEKNPLVRLLIVGCVSLSNKFDPFMERIAVKGFVSWRELPMLIRSVDINLMPLVDNYFNQCKSENKWTEASLVKRATIASYNSEIGNVVADSETQFCEKADVWSDNLRNLIEDEQLRQKMADNAFNQVISQKITVVHYKELVMFIESLFS